MPQFTGTLKAPRQSAAPSSPVAGQVYYDTDDNILYWWNGTAWLSSASGGGFTVYEQSGTPTEPTDNGDIWIDTDESPPVWVAQIPLVTSLPSSAYDGQEIYYQSSAMATDGIVWHLRYRAASASSYKWEYIGGLPLFSEVAASQNMTTNASYIALSTPGPSVTLPIAGDYLVAYGAGITGNADASHVWMSFDIGATGAVDADGIDHYTGATISGGFSPFIPMMTQRRKNGLTAVTLTAKYKSPSTGAYFMNRWMQATPVRVG